MVSGMPPGRPFKHPAHPDWLVVMARLQVLYLPSVDVGGERDQPFALVVDEVSGVVADDGVLHAFGEKIGARGVLVANGRIDLVDEPSVDDDGPVTLRIDPVSTAQAFAEALRAELGEDVAQAVQRWAADVMRHVPVAGTP